MHEAHAGSRTKLKTPFKICSKLSNERGDAGVGAGADESPNTADGEAMLSKPRKVFLRLERAGAFRDTVMAVRDFQEHDETPLKVLRSKGAAL